MIITQKQAIEAYKAIRKIEKQDMPGGLAMLVFTTRKALEPQFQFQDEQEHKIVEQLGCRINDNGIIEFQNVEDQQKYLEKLNEIFELEVEVDLEKKIFPVRDIKMNVSDIEALEPIFNIVC